MGRLLPPEMEERFGSAELFMQRVRQWLSRTGTSQRALSLASGIDPTAFNRWVRGHRSPSLENMIRIEMGMQSFTRL